MERTLHRTLTPILLLLLLLCGTGTIAQSKGEEKKEKDKKAVDRSRSRMSGGAKMMRDAELEEQFASKRPSKAELQAFETRSGQKVEELAEYIELLSDSSYGSAIRKRASEQALELFDRADRQLAGIYLNRGKQLEGKVPTVLDSLKARDDRIVQTEVKDLKSSSFERTEEGHYEGELSFTLTLTVGKEKGETPLIRKEVRMQGKSVLKKVSKNFGDDERMVWEVFLGSIEKATG